MIRERCVKANIGLPMSRLASQLLRAGRNHKVKEFFAE